ncbi:MAG TPA: tRNA pseudouridine(55) synthase TruB [Candidatus Binataceae bacterium]|nr:tRNA pseudouridine(55) synthase TruB [Candidatus Binataceae bacterium]
MDAVILLDKPAGITSAEAVRRIKRFVKPARVGHLGTLDPFATGLLPIMIGEATKLAPFLEGGDKEYIGTIKLGAETDTLDRDGAIIRTAEVPALTPGQLGDVASRFIGKITQTPPIFSAIKREGVPMYKLARKNIDIEAPPPREVEIKSLHLEAAGCDQIKFAVVCSPGTYVRSLARDIGAALGTAAYLDELRRTRTSGFHVADALALDAVVAALEAGDTAALKTLAPRQAVAAMPEIAVDSAAERRLRNGDSSALDMMAPVAAGYFKVISDSGALVAVARATSRVTAIIERIFNP